MRTDAAGKLDRWGWLFLVMGAGSVANALWMLGGPMHWYTDLPAAVPDTGPFNPHFVRDIGCAFFTAGAALGWAAFAPRWRLPLVATATIFFTAHALLHSFDTAIGNLPQNHWWLDVPGVYAPAVLLIFSTAVLKRREGEDHATRAH
jgi:hypothetical protein